MSFDLKLENGDFVISRDKSLTKVFNDDKIRQDILKVILTPIGSNKLFPWYGSPITERSIGKILDKRIIQMEMTNSLVYAINNLMALQKDQERSGQYISPAEAIAQIIDIAIDTSIYDQRQVNIGVAVASRRANVVEESFKLRI